MNFYSVRLWCPRMPVVARATGEHAKLFWVSRWVPPSGLTRHFRLAPVTTLLRVDKGLLDLLSVLSHLKSSMQVKAKLYDCIYLV